MHCRGVVIAAALGLMLMTAGASGEEINLAGMWRIALDREDAGLRDHWFKAALPGNATVRLPGSMQEQGFGDACGPSTPWVGDVRHEEWNKPKYAPYRSADHFKMPFWLQPDRYYKGAAWYQKTVTIPGSWQNKDITLTLERPHWETRVWVDSNFAGAANYLSVPHTYDLSGLLTPGVHTLTIRADNRMIVNVGPNSHSISDHTQSNWNGIVGQIKLTAETSVGIEDVQVYPDAANSTVKIITQLANQDGKGRSGQLLYEVMLGQKKVGSGDISIQLAPEKTGYETVIGLEGPVKEWDEFNPALYTLCTRLKTELGTNERVTTFGMRQVGIEGNRLLLNGRRIFLRGTLECCVFPKTGYPPTDTAAWKRIVNICKAHGLNHIRFHSWCPPEAAFAAADELGFYYQVECSSWANQGSSIGDGKDIDAWLYDEADAILKLYGNHPSFLLFAFGNEPTGPENGAAYLRKWVSHYRQKDSRRLVTGGSGWPLIEESDFHITPEPRIQGWGQELKSRINSKAPETTTDYADFTKRYPGHPVIAHEIGQWCVYPSFDEIRKYTGVLKAKNFEIFRDFLAQKNMAEQAQDFLMASGKLQTLCYKEEIESALRTRDFGGFQLLGLCDFPGQGTALVGVLDAFWDAKPYVNASEFRRFCGPIVPLARLGKRVFTSSETLTAQIDVSHFGPEDLSDVTIKWTLADGRGNTVRQGALLIDKLVTGDLQEIGDIAVELSGLAAPAKYSLEVALENAQASNGWDIWVYPDTAGAHLNAGIEVVEDITAETVRYLQQGGKVLLALNPARVKTNVKLGFSSIFWNTAWTNGQAPHTLGILCDPTHPALAEFPTESHSNWQWSELIQHAATMEMDALGGGLRPIVQVVPDWFEPKRLGLIFEAKVDGGAIVVCSVDITNELEKRPAARQLRYSLLQYLRSDKFAPEAQVSIESIRALMR